MTATLAAPVVSSPAASPSSSAATTAVVSSALPSDLRTIEAQYREVRAARQTMTYLALRTAALGVYPSATAMILREGTGINGRRAFVPGAVLDAHGCALGVVPGLDAMLEMFDYYDNAYVRSVAFGNATLDLNGGS